MQRILSLSILALPLASAWAALPGDSTAGKRLHDAHCLSCHDAGVYTRKDHRVQSLAALRQRLAACEHATGKEFTPGETRDLIKYLNERFYQFR